MIFWEHIKGLNVSGTTKAWSYINFQTTVAGNTSSDVNMTCNPTVGFGDSGYSVANKNYILTSHMTEGYINNAFWFLNDTTWKRTVSNVNKVLSLTYPATDLWKFASAQDIYMECETGSGQNRHATLLLTSRDDSENNRYARLAYGPNSQVVIRNGTISIDPTNTAANSGRTDLHRLTIFDELRCSSDLTSGYTGSCTATYFNATSDYRAKKDFKELNINALELIKKVRLYSFKYKDSNQPSIGIIAQDVQDINIEGFDLVDNKTATGDNFDYMTIHESKLIYILWKAIQEQQKEIEELKRQLNK